MQTNFIKKKPARKIRVTGVTTERNILDHRPEFERTLEIINGTGKVVYVGYRDGSIASIKPITRTGLSNEIIFRRRTIFNRDNSVTLRSIGKTPTTEEEAIRKSYESIWQLAATLDLASVTDYTVTLADLEKNGGESYFSDIDAVVSINSLESMPFHPYSSSNEVNNFLTADINNDFDATTISIKVIDRSGKYDKFYINLGGQVHIVPVLKMPELEEGVYIFRSKLTTGEIPSIPGALKTSISDHCPSEGTIQPFLYHNYQDAAIKGDPFTYKETEQNEIMAELKNKELELKNRKIELERELTENKAKLEAEAESLKKERLNFEQKITKEKYELDKRMDEFKARQQEIEHHQKVKSLMIKDDYEEKSYKRKDSSDVLKYIPTMLTGILGLAALAGKLK